MKLFTTLFVFTLFAFSFSANASDGYKIKCKVNGVKDSACYLAYYFGDKQYLKDTAKSDAAGNFEFSGKEKLPGGIYMIVMPKRKYFEVILDKEQVFSLETDTADFSKNMKIKGSKDNEVFYQYLDFITKKSKEMEALKEEQKDKDEKSDLVKKSKEKMQKVDAEVKEYKLQFIKDHPDMLLSQVFKASQEPDIPEAPLLPNGKKDSTYAYRFFKAHYWDGTNFTDERILRTPVFANKVKYYMEKLVLQIPDSLNKESEFLVEKARPNKEMFKYMVYWLTNTYETSNLMGADAVFVNMVKKYYKTGQAYWVNDTVLKKINDRGDQLDKILIGKVAPDLLVQDTNLVNHPLSAFNAKVTLLYFWDPDCGHCKKVTPKVLEFYQEYKSKGVEVFAVCTNFGETMDLWKKGIKEMKLKWFNVADLFNKTGYKKTYDIYSTPVMYVLDKDKKIRAKRIGPENLKDIVDRILKDQEKK
jgi:thiol-disulfide isomerase/thioredoxin